MKKGFLLSLLLILVAVLPIVASASEIAEPQIQYKDGVVSVLNTEQLQKDYVLIGAQYDDNSTMTKVKAYDAADSISVMNEFDPSSSVKFMLWNSLSGMKAAAKDITVETTSGVILKTYDFDNENPAYRNYDNTGEGVEATGRFYFGTDGGASITAYKLASDNGNFTGTYYVNGVELTNKMDFRGFVSNYIENNDVGSITLLSEGAQSDVYDKIMVTYYEDAVVNSVETDSNSADIYFLDFEEGLDNCLSIEYNDKAVNYSITKNGVEINAADIKPYDVVSIARDVSENFSDSLFYNIIVSEREPLTGRGASRTRYGLEYQINGIYYPAVEVLVSPRLDRYTTYTWYLDTFGRIAYVEEVASSNNFAILDSIYRSTDQETIYVKLVYNDGTSGSVKLGSKLEANEQQYYDYIWGIDGDAYKKEPQDRVITYKTNSAGELTAVAPLSDDYRAVSGEYSSAHKRIGLYPLTDNTSILAANNTGYTWEFSSIDASMLTDGHEYTAYFYNRLQSGNYSFVIIYGVDLPEATDSPESEEQIGILESIYRSADGEKTNVSVINSSGTAVTASLGSKLEANEQQYYDYIWGTDGDAHKNDPQDRVITYKTNSAGELAAVDLLSNDYRAVSGAYSSASGQIGDYALTGASIVAANDNGGSWDIAAADASMLTDGKEYTAYFYNRLPNGNYSFVIIYGVDLPEATDSPESEEQIGILESIYRSADGEKTNVSVINSSGTAVTAPLGSKLEANEQKYYDYIWGTDGDAYKNEPQDRVITYKTNSNNELSKIEYMTYSETMGEYRADTKSIGKYKFSDKSNVVIMAQDGYDWIFKPMKENALYDGEEYTAYFYDQASDGTYNYIMIIDSAGGWNKYTNMAVYLGTQPSEDEDYEYEIELLVPDSNDTVTIPLSDEYYYSDIPEKFYISYSDIERGRIAAGTPVLYLTDWFGAIANMRTVFSQGSDYFIGGTFEDLKALYTYDQDLSSFIDTSFKSGFYSDREDEYKLIFGLITNKSESNTLDFVTLFRDSGYSVVADTVNDAETYLLTDDTTVYVYDYNGRYKYNNIIKKGDLDSIKATIFNSRSWVYGSDDTIADMANVSKPQYAVARVLGDDIMEIMVFVPEK